MNRFFTHLASGGHDPSRFSGRVGSIVCRFRPAFVLNGDRFAANPDIPADFAADFAALEPHIEAAAAATGKIQTRADGNKQILGTCFRVGADRSLVATARHVARALLQPQAGLCAGADPQVMPNAKSALIDLEVEFEAGTGRPVEIIGIESIVFAHPVLDLMLLRLETASARDPLPLADPLVAADARDAPLWIVGYPVTRPSSSEDPKFEAVFGPADAATTGVKRASPGRLQKAPVPPDAGSADVKHDATTLPGSSGSPILDGRTGGLIGLHYRGDAGDSWNMMIYLPNALADGALRDRFDPAVAKDAVRAFPATSGAIDIVEIGRPHVRLMTADDMLEVAVDDGAGPASAAPGEFADSPRAVADRHDIRDRYYSPVLGVPVSRYLPDPPDPEMLHHQTQRADCCGCAVATVVERALAAQGRPGRCSARMLYEMGRLHDEFVDDLPGGTSLRGAIKGFFHNGAAPKVDGDDKGDWFLSIDLAKKARMTTLGAYYRLQPSLPDFQMAIQETGAVAISAWTHSGWRDPVNGVIERRPDRCAAHAFVLVGYDETGFLVQNSWGPGWGGWQHPETGTELRGVAHWSYADWAATVMDGWVLQVAAPAPSAHNLPLPAYQQPDAPRRSGMPDPFAALPKPRRLAIIGHIAHSERLGLVEDGRIGAGQRSLRRTALHLGSYDSWSDPEKRYTALAFLFHDPTLGPESAARLSAHLVPRFKAARVYPVNIIHGADEIRSLVVRMTDEAAFASAIGAQAPQDITAFLDRRAARIAEPLLAAFLDGCAEAAAEGGALWSILANFGAEAIYSTDKRRTKPRPVHVIGFGMGAFAAQACFGEGAADWALRGEDLVPVTPATVTLLAPLGLKGRLVTAPEGWRPHAAGKGPKVRVEPLGPDRVFGSVLDGYRGEWLDLVAGMSPRIESAARDKKADASPHATLAGLLTDTQALNRMMGDVCAKPPLPTWASF